MKFSCDAQIIFWFLQGNIETLIYVNRLFGCLDSYPWCKWEVFDWPVSKKTISIHKKKTVLNNLNICKSDEVNVQCFSFTNNTFILKFYTVIYEVCVYVTETYLERNCTATQTPAYMMPLISHESISRSAMKPTSQMTTKGVPSITFCLNSCEGRKVAG